MHKLMEELHARLLTSDAQRTERKDSAGVKGSGAASPSRRLIAYMTAQVRSGHLSRAAAAPLRAPLAPANDDTLAALQQLLPKEREVVPPPPEERAAVAVEQEVLRKLARKMANGSGAGPS